MREIERRNERVAGNIKSRDTSRANKIQIVSVSFVYFASRFYWYERNDTYNATYRNLHTYVYTHTYTDSYLYIYIRRLQRAKVARVSTGTKTS